MDTISWLYEVTGVNPYDTPYAPDLKKVPTSWLTELPEWFYEETSQYSGWVSDGEKYGDRGRFAGLISNWDQCFLNVNSVCFKPPKIAEDERFVYQGNVKTLEGDIVPVGILAATKGHADDRPSMFDPYKNAMINQGFLDNNAQPLQDSRDIMAHQLIYGRYLNTPEGIAFVGAIFPHVTEDMVYRINASAISGTWIYDLTVKKHVFSGAAFVNAGALPLGHKDKIQKKDWDASDIELRNIAASARYNYIMAVDTTQTDEEVTSCGGQCKCKEKKTVPEETIEKVDAASDPTIGDQEVVLSNEDLTSGLDNVLGRLQILEDQVAGLDREVANLIRSDEARGDL